MLNIKVLISSLVPGSMLTAWVDGDQTRIVAQVVFAVLISFGIFIAILYATDTKVARHKSVAQEHPGRVAKRQGAVRRH